MKEGLHPNYTETTITCACGNVMKVGSTKQDMKLYVKDSTPHTQLAQIWCSQVAKTYINPT